MKISRWMMVSSVAALLIGGSQAADKKKMAETTEMDAKMEQMMKLGSPNENHKILEPFAGKWKYSAQHWMKPGEEAQKSEGTNENTWTFGGRFLKQEVHGNWNGRPFEGMGITGYDNIREEFQSIWMDNMMTGIMQASGTYDDKMKTIKQDGHFSCPMTGEKERLMRSEWKMIDNNSHLYMSYDKDESGKEFKSMEIKYTRVE